MSIGEASTGPSLHNRTQEAWGVGKREEGLLGTTAKVLIGDNKGGLVLGSRAGPFRMVSLSVEDCPSTVPETPGSRTDADASGTSPCALRS